VLWVRIDFGRSIGPLCVGLAALTFKTNQKSKKSALALRRMR
jgi:hypothetical protein